MIDGVHPLVDRVAQALLEHGQELRGLHHAHVRLDANARYRIAEIAVNALGLTWKPGDRVRDDHDPAGYEGTLIFPWLDEDSGLLWWDYDIGEDGGATSAPAHALTRVSGSVEDDG